MYTDVHFKLTKNFNSYCLVFLPSNLSLWYLVSEFFVTRRHKVHIHLTLKCQMNEQIEWFCPDLTEGYVLGTRQVIVPRMNT